MTDLATAIGWATSAVVHDLEHPRRMGMPDHRFNTPPFFFGLHRRHCDGVGVGGRTSSSGVYVASDQSGTHIDALCHQAQNGVMYDGIRADAEVETLTGYAQLAAETIRPIITRGILADLPTHQGVPHLENRHSIGEGEIRSALDAQGTTVRPGNVLLVRTGYGALWDEPEHYRLAAGMSLTASRWIADQRVIAVGADNSGWDISDAVDAELGVTLPGHVVLMIERGILIIENLNLESLAKDRCYEFLFVATPLKLVGATGSPTRPIALASAVS